MKRILAIVFKVIDVVTDRLVLLSGLFICVMSVLATFGVVMRYVFKAPEPYSYEIGVILLFACIMLAIPAVQKERRQLRVDIIVSRLSPKGQNIFENIIVPIVALIFVSVVIWKGWGIFLSALSSGETSQSVVQEKLWPMKLLVPIAMGLLALVLLCQLGEGIRHLVKGTTREDKRRQLDPADRSETENQC